MLRLLNLAILSRNQAYSILPSGMERRAGMRPKTTVASASMETVRDQPKARATAEMARASRAKKMEETVMKREGRPPLFCAWACVEGMRDRTAEVTSASVTRESSSVEASSLQEEEVDELEMAWVAQGDRWAMGAIGAEGKQTGELVAGTGTE